LQQAWCCSLECERWSEGEREKTLLKVFPRKKRINTGLFIGRTATLYIDETSLRDKTKEGEHRVGTDWKT